MIESDMREALGACTVKEAACFRGKKRQSQTQGGRRRDAGRARPRSERNAAECMGGDELCLVSVFI